MVGQACSPVFKSLAFKSLAFKSLFSVTLVLLLLDCIHNSGLSSIGVCVHTTVQGTCHVLLVYI